MVVGEYDSVFNSTAVSTEPLSAKEAKLAIGALAMFSDGVVQTEELGVMADHLLDAEFDAAAMQAASTKVNRIYQEEGAGALFNGAVRALAPDEMEPAFELAVRTALADREVSPEERDYMVALARAMRIAPEKLQQLLADYTGNQPELFHG
ncbi:tellurite resistance TerB family protein [Gloeobacter violaceus]|nr:tellurite resistance TerB family protein [Gloeobacter violaceus]